MIVLIDNHDSFTYNLVQYFSQMDADVKVYSHDGITIEQINELHPALIVLSPGPGTPADAGICPEIVQFFHEKIPILGVCLGHQVIVTSFGGKVGKGKQPMHGKITPVFHNGKGIFHEVTSPATVTRYHSLVAAEEDLPAELEVTARAEDGAIMGVQHRSLPVTGIQFHPESIMTPEGFFMLANCYREAVEWNGAERGRTDRDAALFTV